MPQLKPRTHAQMETRLVEVQREYLSVRRELDQAADFTTFSNLGFRLVSVKARMDELAWALGRTEGN